MSGIRSLTCGGATFFTIGIIRSVTGCALGTSGSGLRIAFAPWTTKMTDSNGLASARTTVMPPSYTTIRTTPGTHR